MLMDVKVYVLSTKSTVELGFANLAGRHEPSLLHDVSGSHMWFHIFASSYYVFCLLFGENGLNDYTNVPSS